MMSSSSKDTLLNISAKNKFLGPVGLFRAMSAVGSLILVHRVPFLSRIMKFRLLARPSIFTISFAGIYVACHASTTFIHTNLQLMNQIILKLKLLNKYGKKICNPIMNNKKKLEIKLDRSKKFFLNLEISV